MRFNLLLVLCSILNSSSSFEGISYEIDVYSWLLALLLFLILIIFYAKKRQQIGLTNEVRNYLKRKINETILDAPLPIKPSAAIQQQIQDMQRRLMALEDAIAGLQTKQVAEHIPIEIVKSINDEVVTDHELVPEAAAISFLPTPNPDGSFTVSTISTAYKEGASIYRMTRTSPYRALFQIDSDETAVRLALQYVELRIEPCCSAQNSYDVNTKGIQVFSQGELELQGDKWNLLRKSEIRYES